MNKFKLFTLSAGQDEVFTTEDFVVYLDHGIGRYLLIKNGIEVAWKNTCTKDLNFAKWINKWEQNAHKQIEALDARINDLRDEQNEIKTVLIKGPDYA